MAKNVEIKTFRELILRKGHEPSPVLSAEHIRKAVEILKKMPISPPPHYTFYNDPDTGFFLGTDEKGNMYHKPVQLGIEQKDMDMEKRFKEIDEQVKKDWGK